MRNILSFTAAILAVILFMVIPNIAMAQECGELCDEDWWEKASTEEIEAAIKNANVNARGEYGETPLFYVVAFGTPKNITALLKASADGSLKNIDGETPFDLAEKNDKVKGTDAYWLLNDARYK